MASKTASFTSSHACRSDPVIRTLITDLNEPSGSSEEFAISTSIVTVGVSSFSTMDSSLFPGGLIAKACRNRPQTAIHQFCMVSSIAVVASMSTTIPARGQTDTIAVSLICRCKEKAPVLWRDAGPSLQKDRSSPPIKIGNQNYATQSAGVPAQRNGTECLPIAHKRSVVRPGAGGGAPPIKSPPRGAMAGRIGFLAKSGLFAWGEGPMYSESYTRD